MHRSLCICALLPRLATRTRVVLVVHQLEANKPTNTGLLAARCLANSTVVYRGRAPDGADGKAPAASAVPRPGNAVYLTDDELLKMQAQGDGDEVP